jgi:hypothetical protein
MFERWDDMAFTQDFITYTALQTYLLPFPFILEMTE